MDKDLDFRMLQKHINYPVILQAIQQARSGHVPQRAAGKYDVLPDNQPVGNDNQLSSQIVATLENLNAAIRNLQSTKLQAEVNYYTFEKTAKTVNDARSRASKR